MAKCRSCGADIFWAITRNGRRIPVDIKSEQRLVLRCGLKTVAPELEFDGRLPLGTIAYSEKTYVAHFVTCPQAEQHRRPAVAPAEKESTHG